MGQQLHQKMVASYVIHGKTIKVDLCWKGDNPDLDGDRFYDFYDDNGDCLNFGNPWHDDIMASPLKKKFPSS